jgi:CheY-like chemotaxis protein
MNILFIEDIPEFAKEIRDLLQDHGHNVTIIDGADAAVEEIPKLSKYDLVILDLMLMLGTKIQQDEGDETGIAIYKRMRAASRDKPILVLTALSKDLVWGSFRDDKHMKFFQKPITADTTVFIRNVEDW